MNWDEYAEWAGRIGTWGADYHKGLRHRPVRAQTRPGEIAAQLPESPPEGPAPMEDIFADIDRIVMPGITHWQHPRFFAYFPSNAAPPSMLADQVTSVLAAQCMLWQTSPAATEVETKVLDWLRQGLGLPEGFAGVIQDSASSATLAAVLTMRERALNFEGNRKGLAQGPVLRIYCSAEVHSSIDKAIWVAGIGQDNLVKVPITPGDPLRGIDTGALRAAIEADKAAGFVPAGVIACVGGTGTGATDNVAAVMDVAEAFDLFTHVDAAWAGSAMLCPEFRTLWDGVDRAHSVVMNPHKWLGTNFDLSAHFLRTPDDLVRTLAIQPEYLKTHGADGIINYSEWSIPLGRRFRALKLWFLIRGYGMEGLRTRLRNHVTWVQGLCEQLRAEPGVEIVTEPILALFTFRYGTDDAFNLDLVNAINDDGRIYLTQTKVDGVTAIRFTGCQFDATREDVETAFGVITEIAAAIGEGAQ
ncbi:aspartate aminotransferase family protein [Aliishimia ponticola]|uniref:Aspartate aminotransferase family protein n=1 Tax=Aliishimia ponticola TaxID=2499833 RepID=A0A4S4NGB2_9RHOB|nr:pyridoxal-dependent decarboxylase [Aliishimia ponticola]THH37178.1 aspartate aminotransferase family protein [Aliishimia ponticola]